MALESTPKEVLQNFLGGQLPLVGGQTLWPPPVKYSPASVRRSMDRPATGTRAQPSQLHTQRLHETHCLKMFIHMMAHWDCVVARRAGRLWSVWSSVDVLSTVELVPVWILERSAVAAAVLTAWRRPVVEHDYCVASCHVCMCSWVPSQPEPTRWCPERTRQTRRLWEETCQARDQEHRRSQTGTAWTVTDRQTDRQTRILHSTQRDMVEHDRGNNTSERSNYRVGLRFLDGLVVELLIEHLHFT